MQTVCGGLTLCRSVLRICELAAPLRAPHGNHEAHSECHEVTLARNRNTVRSPRQGQQAPPNPKRRTTSPPFAAYNTIQLLLRGVTLSLMILF
jgi:hypothetical protein